MYVTCISLKTYTKTYFQLYKPIYRWFKSSNQCVTQYAAWCAWGRGKDKDHRRKAEGFNHIFHSFNPSTRSTQTPAHRYSHTFDRPSSQFHSLLLHLTPSAWLHKTSCSFSMTDPCLFYTWWTLVSFHQEEMCIHPNKMGSENIWWVNIVLVEEIADSKCIELFTLPKLLSGSKKHHKMILQMVLYSKFSQTIALSKNI